MGMGTAHGITVDAFCLDALTTATLDGVIDTPHNRTRGNEPFYQKPEQKATRFPATPVSTAQDTVVVDEMALLM